MNDEKESPVSRWILAAAVGVVCVIVTAVVVWLASFKPPTADRAATQQPATITQTTRVTVTESPTTTASAAPRSSSSNATSQQWVVRTPAGMACLINSTSVTCTGAFDAAVEGYVYTAGGGAPRAVTSPVHLPGQGAELSYGDRRSAGPWVITMSREGITFEDSASGSSVRFSKSGAAVL